MTKSRLFLRNLARCALLLSLTVVSSQILGCYYYTEPTYLKENIADSIRDICKNEYKIDVTTKLTGSTVWIYMPLEDVFSKPEKGKKPEKFLERFAIEQNKNEFVGGSLKQDYLIKEVIPEQEKTQEFVFSKKAYEKVIYVRQVIFRVIFSMDPKEIQNLKFFCLVIADIKNGFVIRDIFYYLDIKKIGYNFISTTEFQHRTVEDSQMAPEIIGDKTGANIYYKDITMQEFISGQILNRIRFKFAKPEAPKGADIDKEIEKVIAYTVKTYDFKDFHEVELNNLVTNRKVILNRAAIWSRYTE